MKTKSFNKFNFKKVTITNLKNSKGGLQEPLRAGQSADNTTCMSMSACDTY
ncbi:hypothetical protein [Kordia zhangzhouensis]|uniref:hypothetical protein n=1 Tax=Kordia zhangzhouensis TaxID=1620405 RepID=UPI0012F84A53|nr:hypothetical protein [Kordia zhangzhouensis]